MITTFCILATILATSLAGSIGSESANAAENGYTYSLGQSGSLSGGRHTDVSSFGSAAVNDFKTLKVIHGNSGQPSGSYSNLDASGLSGGYNALELSGDFSVGAVGGNNAPFGIGYIGGYDGSHSNTFNSAPSTSYSSGTLDGYSSAHSSGTHPYNSGHSSGYGGGHNENIRIIRIIHEFVGPNHGQSHGSHYGSKRATTYKLIHDYGHNTGGLAGYAYVTSNGQSDVGQNSEEPSQIIKVIHEKSTSSKNSPHSGLSYSNFDQTFNKGTSSSVYSNSLDHIKSLKALGALASLGVSSSYGAPSTSYTSPQSQYLPPTQEYFPPASSGGYKYKQ